MKIAGANLELEDEDVERIAQRVAAIQGAEPGWLDAKAAAAYMGCPRSRIYNLRSDRRLAPDGFDGNKPMWRRSTLDAYLERSNGDGR